MYDTMIWGTPAQWASAVGTTLAFTATFYVIRRDAKIRRRTQMSKVALYLVETPREPADIDGKRKNWYYVTVKNFSDEPIYNVTFYMYHWGLSRPLIIDGVKTLWPDSVLLGGQSDFYRSESSDGTYEGYEILVQFRDNSGRWWQRTLNGRAIELGRIHRWASQRRLTVNQVVTRIVFGRTNTTGRGRHGAFLAR